jgi:hypothetical protein
MTGLAVWPVHLDHGDAFALEIPRDANPIRAGALDTDQD